MQQANPTEQLVRALNLSTGVEMTFDPNTVPDYAVAYGYCEEHNRMSWLFAHVHDNRMDEVYRHLPMLHGEKTVSCGDWCALRRV